MDRYIGLDAHSQTCTFAVMSPTGRRLREQIVETHGSALIDCVKAIAGTKHLCFEEGTHSEWLYEVLTPHVRDIVVVQPRPNTGQKSDSIDAWGLADQIRRGTVQTAVFKAPGLYSELRAAVRAYQVVVRDCVRAKCRVKALYRSRGVSANGTEVFTPEHRDEWLEKLPSHRRKLAEILLTELDAITAVRRSAEQWLLQEATRCSIVKLLATAPGIGMTRAAQIVAIVITPTRFRTRQQFWSYCGLGIVTQSSSDWMPDGRGKWIRREMARTKGLNRNRQPILKAVFKGAALSVIQSTPKQPMHQDYQRLIAADVKPPLARLTIARKIAATVLAMWKNKEEYDPAKSQPKPHAA
jgi:transposase